MEENVHVPVIQKKFLNVCQFFDTNNKKTKMEKKGETLANISVGQSARRFAKRIEADLLLCLMVNCICCSLKQISILESALAFLCFLFHEICYFLKVICSPYLFTITLSIFNDFFRTHLSKIVLEICESRNTDCLIKEKHQEEQIIRFQMLPTYFSV